jgi:RHS repeat-associated protein
MIITIDRNPTHSRFRVIPHCLVHLTTFRALAGMLGLLLLFLNAPVSADPGNGPPLPRVTAVDQNGVDLLYGRRTSVDSDVGVGLADAPDLELAEGFNGFTGTPLGGFHYTDGSYPNYSDFYVLGERGETNNYGGAGRYLPDGMAASGSGSTWTLVEKDGTRWNFAPTNMLSPAPDKYLTSMVRADGEVLTYTYSSIPGGDIRGKLNSIRSSAGYQMNFQWTPVSGSYRLTKVTLSNRRYAYCDANTGACTGTYTWPSIAWSVDASGNTTATTSGVRNVIYGAVVRGPQVGGTSTQPVYEWNTTVTSGAGVQRTFTNRYWAITSNSLPLYYGRPSGAFYANACTSESVIWRVQDAGGTWNYAYSGNNPACAGVSRTDPLGKQINRVVDTATNENSLTDELGRKTTYTFVDQWNNSSNEGGEMRHLTSRTHPEGDEETWTYDFIFNVTGWSHVPKPGSAEPTLSSTATYPSSCNVTTTAYCAEPSYTIDPRGKRTDYTYDARHGGILTKTLPADANGIRPQVRYTYTQLSAKVLNSSGQLVSETPIWKLTSISACRTQATCAGSADEIVKDYAYDDNLLPISETIRAGDNSVSTVTTKAYDEVGNLVSVDGPLAGTQDKAVYLYDALRRLTGLLQPDPDGSGSLPVPAVRTTYNGDGQATLVETGSATAQTSAALAAMTVDRKVATSYDSAGRKVKETVTGTTGATEAVTQYSYDGDSRLQCTVQRLNPAVYGSLPASACTLGTSSATYGADRIAKTVFDDAGQPVQQWNAAGTVDAAAVVTRSYTDNGRVKFVVDGNGNRAELRYDGLDRLVCWLFPSKTRPTAYNPSTVANALATAGATNGDCSSTGDFEKYGFDPNGNRTSYRKRDGSTLTYTFDDLNRVTIKIVPSRNDLTASQTRDVYYAYDLQGHLTDARFDSLSGAGLSNTYDALGHLTASTNSMSAPARTVSYSYYADGTRQSVTHPDGAKFSYSRDGLGRTKSVYEGATESTTTDIDRYVYNGNGSLASLQRGDSTNGFITRFGYDSAGRVNSIANDLNSAADDFTIGLTYNPASQIVQETRDNAAYSWSEAYNVNRGYSTNGLNQYATAGPATFTYDANGSLTSDGSANFGYDVENRLVSASGAKTAALVYDPLGHLFQTSGGASGATQFLYDGDELVDEFGSAGSLLNRYVHGDGSDDPLVAYQGTAIGASARKYLMRDQHGSIVALVNGDGSRGAINAYDEYGIPSSSNSGRFQYTGQMYIPELGMYYYKARMYSATTGRFMQTDPIGYEGGVNLYAYVHDDPIDLADSTGAYACSPAAAHCDEFLKAQDEAKARLTREIVALSSLRRALEKNSRLSSSQRSLQERLERYLGRGAGSNANAIRALIGKGQAILGELKSWDRVVIVGQLPNDAYGSAKHGAFPTELSNPLFTRGFEMQQETIVHEASHDAAGTIDYNGPYSYGEKYVTDIARGGPAISLQNADNVAFALGFQRDDD